MPSGALILRMMLLFRYLFIIHGIVLQRGKKKQESVPFPLLGQPLLGS